MKRTILPLILIVLLQWPMFAQVAIGQWREHLPYRHGLNVAHTGNTVYCATESGLYYYDLSDMSVQRLSKVNGLSDVGFSSIAYDESSNTLVIAYSNTNIDLLQDNVIINLPDIKNKPILGNKTINHIKVSNGLAYLACGFGIVVLDLVKQEVKDTYYIGQQGAQVVVNDIDMNSQSIYAATQEGLYQADRNSPFLANFEEWERDTTLGTANYNTIAVMGSRIMINRDEDHDTIYWKDNGPWNYFDTTHYSNVYWLESVNGSFTVSDDWSIDVFNQNLQRTWHLWGYPNLEFNSRPSQVIVGPEDNLWVADREVGLIKVKPGPDCERINVNGPQTIGVYDISVWDSRLYVASGGLTGSYNNTYSTAGLFHFEDENWKTLNSTTFSTLGTVYDIVRVKVDPTDSKRVYASSWGTGLLELYDGVPTFKYDSTNSGLRPLVGTEDNYRLLGLEVDNDGNLWIGATAAGDHLYCKTPAGDWYSYYFGSIVSSNTIFGDMAIDDIGQKWIIAPRGGGLIVFNDGETLANTSDDQMIKLTQGIGNGNLSSNDIYSIAKDLDGEIWVGTNNGISVFYTPESVFDGGDFDSQQILIEQDGYTQHLLENEAVNDIAIDGANRKWIATGSAGIFLMSEDGTEEIHHFTTENSPLFSDAINSIAIDHLTGEVFIGTEKGLLSYRSDATYGGSTFDDYDVYAFPNPVEPGYLGPIAIKGLVTNSDVKIADVAGNVVYATTAEGGTATWNGMNPSGERAKSGVYLVFASNEDGKEAMVTKILLVN